MKTDPGRIWINTGLLLLTAALFLWAYNGQESRRAGDAAQQVITELTQSLTQEAATEGGAAPEQEDAPAVKLPEYLLDDQREMPEKNRGRPGLYWGAEHSVSGFGIAGAEPVELPQSQSGPLPLFRLFIPE